MTETLIAPLSVLLSQIDDELEEPSRRDHRFAWLRDPDTGEWLVVDAYYPRSRLVVFANGHPGAEQAREHGLSAVTLVPDASLESVLADLEAAGVPAPTSSPTAEPVRTGRPETSTPIPDVDRHARRQAEGEGIGLGLMLGVVMLVEAIIAVVTLTLDDGLPILGASLLLDAAARLTGVIACGNRHDHGGAWTVALVGSPALWTVQPEDDATRLARGLAVAAGLVFVLGIVSTAL